MKIEEKTENGLVTSTVYTGTATEIRELYEMIEAEIMNHHSYLRMYLRHAPKFFQKKLYWLSIDSGSIHIGTRGIDFTSKLVLNTKHGHVYEYMHFVFPDSFLLLRRSNEYEYRIVDNAIQFRRLHTSFPFIVDTLFMERLLKIDSVKVRLI